MADLLYHVGDSVIVRDRQDLESDPRLGHGGNNDLITPTGLSVPNSMMMEVCGMSSAVSHIVPSYDGVKRYALIGSGWFFDDYLLLPFKTETDEFDDVDIEIDVLL